LDKGASMTGYVRLHRSLIGHAAFRNDAEAMAFAWMIARAAWKPARVRYKGKAISLNRGQLAISVRDMADAMDRDKAWVERLFTRLKRETMIETVTQAGVSVVTICNYVEYQSNSEQHEAGDETPRETGARQVQDTEQEPEEDNKKIDCRLDDFPNRVVETWNTETAGTPLPKARPLTPDRRKHLAVRAKEHGEDAVFAAIRNMAASEFHSGKSGKWTEGNLGWLLKSPENFTKMLERSAPAAAKQSVPVEQTIRARQDQARIYRRMGRESEADELDRETERIRKAAGIGEILHRMPPNPTPQAEGRR